MLILILNILVAVGYAAFHIGNRTWEYKGKLFKKGGEVPKLTSADCPDGMDMVNGRCVYTTYKEGIHTITLDPPTADYEEAQRRGKQKLKELEIKELETEIRWELGKEEWKREEERRQKLSPPPVPMVKDPERLVWLKPNI